MRRIRPLQCRSRAAGVDCAQWEVGSTETILATAIDGALGRMNGPASKLARCAIYTRKSTEYNLELAFNSLDEKDIASRKRGTSARSSRPRGAEGGGSHVAVMAAQDRDLPGARGVPDAGGPVP
jgi:hypothetical protein